MTKNELNALVVEYGIDGASDRLGLSEEELSYAIYNDLDRKESAELDKAYAEYEIETPLDELTKTDEIAEQLDRIESMAGENWDGILDNVLSGIIPESQLETFEVLAGNLTNAQFESVLAFIDEQGSADIIGALFEGFEADSDFYSDSAFWEWFRDTFYSD